MSAEKLSVSAKDQGKYSWMVLLSDIHKTGFIFSKSLEWYQKIVELVQKKPLVKLVKQNQK